MRAGWGHRCSRRGFTLVELLVVMALIATLAAIALVVAPSALEKDRAATAVTQLQGAMQISRAKALRDGLPRGIRLISNPAPTPPLTATTLTEYQYIEAPPVFVPNPGGPTGLSPYATNAAPYVQFNYTLSGGPPATTVTNRSCTIVGLTADHQAQVVIGGMLYLPTLGTWHKIIGGSAANPLLDSYPDQQLGAETLWRTYHFGLYGAPRPLLGEPVLQLPVDSCVDVSLSYPAGASDYDILFAPSGQLVWTASTQGQGQVFLWVRDPSRPLPTWGNSATYSQAGEQLIVGIKAKSGAIGAAPLDYGADPYFLARKALSGQ